MTRTATSRSIARSGSRTAARSGGRRGRSRRGSRTTTAVARGEAGIVGDDYRELTGKEPLTIRELVELHRDEMPLTRSVAHETRP